MYCFVVWLKMEQIRSSSSRRNVLIMLLIVVNSVRGGWESNACVKMNLMFYIPSGEPLSYLAIVASKGRGDIAGNWQLPIQTIVYSNDPTSGYSVVEKGFPSSTYIKFMVDHYACIPRWVLFLHDPIELYHPISSLLDLNLIDRGYIALASFKGAGTSMHPASEGFSAGVSPLHHKAAFISVEVIPLFCFNSSRFFHSHNLLTGRPSWV